MPRRVAAMAVVSERMLLHCATRSTAKEEGDSLMSALGTQYLPLPCCVIVCGEVMLGGSRVRAMSWRLEIWSEVPSADAEVRKHPASMAN